MTLRECFSGARRDEARKRKHKGLLVVRRDDARAREYLLKAQANLELCTLFRERGLDYKIPEEWFYTLYYCALAVLCKFGVESRSQRCTALFLRYVKDAGLIAYDDDLIARIMVHREKHAVSDVDRREAARYGADIQSEEVRALFDPMMEVCRRALDQCAQVVYSGKEFKFPDELLSN